MVFDSSPGKRQASMEPSHPIMKGCQNPAIMSGPVADVRAAQASALVDCGGYHTSRVGGRAMGEVLRDGAQTGTLGILWLPCT